MYTQVMEHIALKNALAQPHSLPASPSGENDNAVTRGGGTTSRPPLTPLNSNGTYCQAIVDECAAWDIPLNGETNYNKQMTLFRAWLKENGKDVKSFLPLMSHFNDYFNSQVPHYQLVRVTLLVRSV